jgi:hypothetical protein
MFLDDGARDAIGVAAGKTATFSGAGAAFVFGLSANEFAALVGVFVGIAGLCVQVYYNRRRDRREDELHAVKLARWRDDN